MAPNGRVSCGEGAKVRHAAVPDETALGPAAPNGNGYRRARSNPRHDRLCWVKRGSPSPTLGECVPLEAWSRSLWSSNAIRKTAVLRTFELTNRVTTSWLSVSFGEPGLDYPRSVWACKDPEQAERCSPPSGCGQLTP
jgi:hypothetical protein